MIEVEGLTKYYGEHAAIRDLSFTINKGEVIGFLGLNGAGKSTTLRVLGAVLLPTAGRVKIDGVDLGAEPHEVRKRIGFLPDVPPLYNEMTVGAYLAFVAQLRGVPADLVDARVREAEQKTALGDVHDDVIGTLSHGYRQRVGVAQALVHKPAAAHPRRADRRARPGPDPRDAQPHPRAQGRAHGALVEPHPDRGLADLRSPAHHRRGQAGRPGHRGRAVASGSGAAVEIEVVAGGADKAKAALSAVDGVRGVEVLGPTQLRVQAAPELRPALVRALVGANVDVLRIDRAASQLESIFTELTTEA